MKQELSRAMQIRTTSVNFSRELGLFHNCYSWRGLEVKLGFRNWNILSPIPKPEFRFDLTRLSNQDPRQMVLRINFEEGFAKQFVSRCAHVRLRQTTQDFVAWLNRRELLTPGADKFNVLADAREIHFPC